MSTELGRILVLGGTGFLGHRIVRRLLDRGYTVRVASRHPERSRRMFPDELRSSIAGRFQRRLQFENALHATPIRISPHGKIGCTLTDDPRVLCSEPHVFHVRIGIESIARFLAEAGEAREVDPDQLPVALHDLARDEHGIDVL